MSEDKTKKKLLNKFMLMPTLLESSIAIGISLLVTIVNGYSIRLS
jgi:hypothetical protein